MVMGGKATDTGLEYDVETQLKDDKKPSQYIVRQKGSSESVLRVLHYTKSVCPEGLDIPLNSASTSPIRGVH